MNITQNKTVDIIPLSIHCTILVELYKKSNNNLSDILKNKIIDLKKFP